jgi:hypothetical protein
MPKRVVRPPPKGQKKKKKEKRKMDFGLLWWSRATPLGQGCGLTTPRPAVGVAPTTPDFDLSFLKKKKLAKTMLFWGWVDVVVLEPKTV